MLLAFDQSHAQKAHQSQILSFICQISYQVVDQDQTVAKMVVRQHHMLEYQWVKNVEVTAWCEEGHAKPI